jgi:tRNA uridine 5-carboxymethylaminomethyl modification enzyme
MTYADLARVEGIGRGVDDAAVVGQIEVQAKYAGYLERQRDEIERQRRNEDTEIPERFDFRNVRGLSAEVTAKLVAVRPSTIGQAMRISGVTPAAISLLLVHLKRGGRRVA